jgi:hypothetical protein
VKNEKGKAKKAKDRRGQGLEKKKGFPGDS